MRMEDFFTENGDFHAMAKAEEIGVGKAFLKAAEKKLKRVRDDAETNPKTIENGNSREDIRFKLGQIDALKWLLSLPEETRQHLERLKNKNK